MDAAKQITKDFGEDPDIYTGALIQMKEGAKQNELDNVQKAVSGMGFNMEAQNSTFKTISSLLRILDLWISITGAVIFLAGGIALAQLYQLLLVERKQELQTLRYFGAHFGQILLILLVELFAITSLGMIVGTLIGVGGASLVFPFISSKVEAIAGIPFPITNTTMHPWTLYMAGGVVIFVLVLIFPMLWRLRAQKGLNN